MTHRQRAPQTLELPRRTDLPYFAYGLFKPGELAYGQLEPLVNPVEAQVNGTLYVRDGLPLLVPGGVDTIRGCLLRFRKGEAEYAFAGDKALADHPGFVYLSGYRNRLYEEELEEKRGWEGREMEEPKAANPDKELEILWLNPKAVENIRPPGGGRDLYLLDYWHVR